MMIDDDDDDDDDNNDAAFGVSTHVADCSRCLLHVTAVTSRICRVLSNLWSAAYNTGRKISRTCNIPLIMYRIGIRKVVLMVH